MIQPSVVRAVAALVTGVAVLLLVASIRRDATRRVRTVKTVASLGFVAVALAGWERALPVDLWLITGLLLGAVGDVLLLEDRTFDAGLAAFLLGHVAYIAAFHSAVPVASWPLPLLILPTALGIAAATWLWGFLGRRLPAVLAYVASICIMTWGGLSVWALSVLPWTAAVGAVLFTLSDLAVARQRFVTPAFANRAIGLPAYYAGQLLLATTVGSV